MKDEWGDEKYNPIICSTADKEVLEQKQNQKEALLVLSREGAQVEGRTEEGEPVALALDNQQVHDPSSDEADPVDRGSFRLSALLLSAAADEQVGHAAAVRCERSVRGGTAG